MFERDVEKDSQMSPKTGGVDTYGQPVKVRCPECYKLYSINAQEINEPRPRFACVQCKTQFWVPFPEAAESTQVMLGFPMDWDRAAELAVVEAKTPEPQSQPQFPLEERVFNCPKCSQPYSAKQKECKKCGVIFHKFFEKQNEPVDSAFAPKEVKSLWEDLIHHYDDFSKHQAFIAAALANDSFDYAFHQYEKILSVCPTDDLALRAQNELKAIATTVIEVKQTAHWSDSFKSIGFPRLKIVALMYFLCAVVIAIGVVFPQFRNLVGFGSAVLFTLLALRFYFKVL